MTRFPRAVEEAQGWYRTAFADAPGELLDTLAKPSTPEQAAPVADCVERFSRAELEGTALGRYGPVQFFPPLGDHQVKKLRNAPTDQKERVRDAIAFAVAMGYTLMAGSENGQPQPGRSSEDIWNVWIPNLNSGMVERMALPPDMLSDLRQMGADTFQERALELGLGGFGRKARIGHSGAFYAQAGALLRAVQVHEEDLKPDPANVWPYVEHPA